MKVIWRVMIVMITHVLDLHHLLLRIVVHLMKLLVLMAAPMI